MRKAANNLVPSSPQDLSGIQCGYLTYFDSHGCFSFVAKSVSCETMGETVPLSDGGLTARDD